MERSLIENKIAQLLMEMYPESEYKALVTATTIVDILMAENLINLNSSKIKPGNSPGTIK